MVTVEKRSGGTYAISWPQPGPFLVVSKRQLRELLIALGEAGLIRLDTATSQVTIR